MKSSTWHPRDTTQDRVTYIVINTVLVLFGLAVLYPLIFVVSASFSNAIDVAAGRVLLWPVNFSLAGYKMVFSHKLIMSGYRNTLFYTTVGTVGNLVLTIMCAYPLSRREMPFRNFFMVIFAFTMFFSGGLVPTYLLMHSLGLLNTVWVMIIPGVSVWNMILLRTSFMTVPKEMYEASVIDGCSYWKYLVRILIPLSKAVLAVIALYNIVGIWNSFFSALIFLKDRDLYPLQLVMRQILSMTQMTASDINASNIDAESMAQMQWIVHTIKYAMIVAASVPVLAVYPFIQKYFVKGVMIGSLKG